MKDAPQNKARDYLLAGMLEKRAQDIEKKGLDNGMGTSAGMLLEGAKSSDKVHAQVKDILDFSKELQNADLSDMLRYSNPDLYKAMEMGEIEGAMSSLSVAVAGGLTVAAAIFFEGLI